MLAKDANQSSEGSCSPFPGRWVCPGPWHRAYVAREAQIGSADALAIPESSLTWVGSGHVCPSQGPEQYWTEGQARPWRGRHLESEMPGAAPESVPRAEPSSHTDRDADTILCGYPAGVKTWEGARKLAQTCPGQC